MRIAVVSLKFSPGHIAHLRAYNALFSEIATDVTLFLSPKYHEYIYNLRNTVFTNDINKIIAINPDIVFIYNISTRNVKLAKECQKERIYTVYVLHEPKGSLKQLLAEGNDIIKTIGANFLNTCICRKVDKVLLASKSGRKNYERYMLRINRNYAVFPLIFVDEFNSENDIKREYFSFIGGFTDVHACDSYLDFVLFCLKEKLNIKFLIATKTDIVRYLENPILKHALESGRLVVHAGQPMSTEEINSYYRQSICVWNAYNRSTQSGVLANSLMQGTPVIVNDNGAAKEIMKDKSVGCYIAMPPDNYQIYDCYKYIVAHLDEMTEKARRIFLKRYCYNSFVELAKERIT